MISIYCDESGHLEHDNSNVMTIGGIYLPNYARKEVYRDIKEIKEKNEKIILKLSESFQHFSLLMRGGNNQKSSSRL